MGCYPWPDIHRLPDHALGNEIMEMAIVILVIFALVQYVNYESLRKSHNELSQAFNELNTATRLNWLEHKISPYLNGEIK